MGMPVRVDEELYKSAKRAAKAEFRTIAGQIEFWAKVGKTALDNPDLPVDFVVDLLRARQEPEKELTEFRPEKRRG